MAIRGYGSGGSAESSYTGLWHEAAVPGCPWFGRYRGKADVHSADLRQAANTLTLTHQKNRPVRQIASKATVHFRLRAYAPTSAVLLEQHKHRRRRPRQPTRHVAGSASSWPAKLHQACCLACHSFCKDRLVLDPQSLLHGAVLHLSRANKLRTESASNARNYCHFFLF
jgi:hypothetical protein